MRSLLESIGRWVGFKHDEIATDQQTFTPTAVKGCMGVAVFAVAFAVLAIVVFLVLLTKGSDPVPPTDSATGDPDAPSTQVDETAGAETAGVYADPDNPTVMIPVAGEWTVDNAMFVPNCGPDEPGPETAMDAGTIAVWASGSILELTGTDSTTVRFDRTSASDVEASYAATVGFVAMELVFESPIRFDAAINYSGDDQCVRRSAQGALVRGDDDLQHGSAEPPGSPTEPGSVVGQAGEGTIAIVTIDDTMYEFFPEGPAGTCDPDFFGRFHAVLYTEGFTDSFNLDLIPNGSRVSTASMTVRDLDLDLVADQEGEWAAVADGTSAVVDFTIEGSTASGSLLFINEDRAFNGANYPLESIEATFTVTCGSA